MTHILAFEHDPTFAAELVEAFAGFGITVEVTDDGAGGLAAAEANPPVLALITVELPSMQGYKICKRFKKSERLSHIPVVMMSGDPGAEDTFANHRKLRMRADEYVLKPITGANLYQTIEPLIPSRPTTAQVSDIAGPPPADFGDADEATVIHSIDVDQEIEAFAENAFQDIMSSGTEPSSSEVPTSEPPMFPPAEISEHLDPSISIEMDAIQFDDDEMADLEAAVETVLPSEPASPPPAVEMPPPPAPTPEPFPEPAPETSLALEESQGRIAALEKQIEEMRAQTPSESGATSSREILDLREKLNAKDRQLLQLRDEAGPKDKEILDLRDRLLSMERKDAESSEAIEKGKRELEASRQRNATLTADNEGFTKRLEDFKGRMDRSDAKVTRLEQEVEEARTQHKGEMERHQADNDIAIAELEEAQRSALNEQQSQASAQAAAAQAAHDEALRAAQAGHAAAMSDQANAHESESATLKANHQADLEARSTESATAIEAARSEHQRMMQEAQEEFATGREAALAELRSELDAQRQLEVTATQEASTQALRAAEDEHNADMARREAEAAQAQEAGLEELRGQHAQELAVLSRKLTESESRGEELDASLKSTSDNLDVARQSIESLTTEKSSVDSALQASEALAAEVTEERDQARGSLSVASDKLSRVAQAMAIGLAIIEDQSASDEAPSSIPAPASDDPPSA